MKKDCGPGKHNGNPCKVCGVKRKRGRPPGKKPPAIRAAAPAPRKKFEAGDAVSARLAGTLGVSAPSSSPDLFGAEVPGSVFGGESSPAPAVPFALPPEPTAPPPPPEGPTWCKSAGRRLTQLFISAHDWAATKLKPKRKLNEPDDDDVDAFGASVGQSLAAWFPDSELSPFKQMLISGAFITGAMWIGSEKLPPERETITDESKATPDTPSPSNGARGADTISPVIPFRG